MKKILGISLMLLIVYIAGCSSSVDENVLSAGNEFYSGSTKEILEEKIETNMASKIIVVDDNYFVSKVKFTMKGEEAIHESEYDRDYIQKNDYKGHPKYEIIKPGLYGDQTYEVVSVNHGDYYYLISLSLISDAEINLDDENSLDSAATYYNLKIKTVDDVVSSDYYYEVLRKIETEE